MTICKLCKGAGASPISRLQGCPCDLCHGWGIIDDLPLPRGWVAGPAKGWGLWRSLDHEIVEYRESLERLAEAA